MLSKLRLYYSNDVFVPITVHVPHRGKQKVNSGPLDSQLKRLTIRRKATIDNSYLSLIIRGSVLETQQKG